MRKRLAVILCLTVSLVFAGCSSGKDTSDSSAVSQSQEETSVSSSGEDEDSSAEASEELKRIPVAEGEFELADCVELGKYQGLTLEKPSVEITEEDVDSYIRSFMEQETVTDPDAQAREGDTVNIAFEGTRDGEAFEGGTSEHSMIGKFIDTIIPEEELPKTLTSYSPCFRKEKGAHGIEERGVYRIHQFEKQEMIVVCKPEESPMWFDKLWQNTVDLFRSMDIPVRTLECCSGDLADLKVKSVDVEAWSPRQKKYFEVGSCSNLGDAQARRLQIRVNGKDGKYLAHTLNNTVVAPPRMLIAFLENNLQADGSVKIPEALRPYMGGAEVIKPKK